LRDLLCGVSLDANNDSGRRGFVRRNGHLPLFWGLQFLVKPDNKWICRYLKDKVGHVDWEGNLSIFFTTGPTMSWVHKIYNDPDAASSFIKKLLETACGLQIRKVHEYYEVVRYPREFAMGFNLPTGVMSNTFVHTSSTILSNESTTEDERSFVDAIQAFNKAHDDEIVTPTTKYDNLK
jgi:hypothetical protein